jgi:hypothetical protein
MLILLRDDRKEAAKWYRMAVSHSCCIMRKELNEW